MVQVVLLLGSSEQPPLVTRQLVAMEHLLTLHHRVVVDVHVLVSRQGISHPRKLVQVVVGGRVRPLLLIGCLLFFQTIRLVGLGYLQQPDLLGDVVGGGEHLSGDSRNATRKPVNFIIYCLILQLLTVNAEVLVN